MFDETQIHKALTQVQKLQQDCALTAEQQAILEKLQLESLSKHSHRAFKTDTNIIDDWHTIVYDSPLPSAVSETVIISFILDLFIGANPDVLMQLRARGTRKTEKSVSYTTILRMLRSWGRHHTLNGEPDPTKAPAIRELLRNIRRNKSIKTKVKKHGVIDRNVLRAMLGIEISEDADTRDSAALLLAFNTGGRRASELAEANIEDFSERPSPGTFLPTEIYEGWYEWAIPTQKNDPESEGHIVPVRGEAAVALAKLLEKLREQGISEGALFRRLKPNGPFGDRITVDGIRKRIIKRRLELAGYDPSEYSSHSIRAGWITEAAEAGYSDRQITAMTGHKDRRSLDSYVRLRRHYASGISNLFDNSTTENR
ncbi:MAG: tyrosine-type recombinase/integrase [Candidatus Thiodiazotropha lotti]|nr:tyrosine-type recombinase/integrase [Candidatus Thiodiazotropha lotti]